MNPRKLHLFSRAVCRVSSVVPGTCCRLLLLGQKSVHCSVASQLAERSRLYAPSNAKKRDIAPERLLLANVLFVADGVRHSVAVSKLGCTELFFFKPAVKVDGRY